MRLVKLNNKMKTNTFCLLVLTSLISWSTMAQRGVRIGYIDTEYILQNVPEYQEANTQLESKVQKWKNDIEKRLNAIDLQKKQLSSEAILLTPELIKERQEDINIEETDILDYQQKRFGRNGDLMIQKKQLMQPIQDQIFAAVQEIAKSRSYDFVFDKSTDVVMLYSADRYDISDQVLRSIKRSSKRTQAKSKKERKDAKAEAIVPAAINKEREAATKAAADMKAERAKVIADKRAKQLSEREAKRKALEEKKKLILEERAKERDAKLNQRTSSKVEAQEELTSTQVSVTKTNESEEKAVEVSEKEKPLSPREARKKILEEKKAKILAARKAKLEAQKIQDSITKSKKNNN